MHALLPLLLPLITGTAAAEAPAANALDSGALRADLVEVHLGANTPGVRLVVRPPANAGPDAEPYVVEVMVPPWPEATTTVVPSLADEPLAEVPVILLAPSTMASAVPTASFATQPIEELPVAPTETAFLRHAPADALLPAPEPIKEFAPPPEWASAAAAYEKSCEGGYAPGCTALAEMVMAGQAGEPDLDRARGWYERGCDQGDAAACAALAPVAPPPAPEVTLASPALAPLSTPAAAALPTATGSASAAAPAAVHAAAPEAPAPGAATAVAPAFAVERGLFDRCQEGDNQACNELGERHTHGEGVSQDYDRAAKLFQRACAGGQMTACTNLGILYQVGEGVSQDELRAERLFQLACNGGAGDERACGLLE